MFKKDMLPKPIDSALAAELIDSRSLIFFEQLDFWLSQFTLCSLAFASLLGMCLCIEGLWRYGQIKLQKIDTISSSQAALITILLGSLLIGLSNYHSNVIALIIDQVLGDGALNLELMGLDNTTSNIGVIFDSQNMGILYKIWLKVLGAFGQLVRASGFLALIRAALIVHLHQDESYDFAKCRSYFVLALLGIYGTNIAKFIYTNFVSSTY